jgi:hypothetical protein
MHPRMLRGGGRDGGHMANGRHNLPVFKHRRQLLDALSHPVSIVEGETGSGKTTQRWRSICSRRRQRQAGASHHRQTLHINIFCTQPRRISAIGAQITCFTGTKVQILTQKALIGVADRVAAERGGASVWARGLWGMLCVTYADVCCGVC